MRKGRPAEAGPPFFSSALGRRSEPDFSTTDRTADSAEDPENRTDDQENDADRVEDGHLQEDAEQQKDESQNQHDVAPFRRRVFPADGAVPSTAKYQSIDRLR